MKKLLNTALSRVVLGALFMILQIAVLVIMVLAFQKYFVYFYVGCVLLTLAVLLYVLNGTDNPAYKIAWMIPIMVMPIFGGLFYLMFGRNRMSVREKKRLSCVEKSYNDAMALHTPCHAALQAQDRDAARQSQYLSNVAAAPLFMRTSSEFLPTGEIYFARMLQELEKAEKFIFMEYFIIEQGKMWDAIVAVLAKKAAAGVDVRVLYDDFGCMLTLPDSYDKTLEKMGIKAHKFNKFKPALSGRFNNRDHRKICVIDGNVGFTGGVNLADEYINAITKHGHWLDCGIVLQGEGVWGFTVMFLSVWDFVRGEDEDFTVFAPEKSFVETIATDGFVQPFTDTPMDTEPVGENVYINIINSAKDYVYISTPYLIIDNEMATALTTAAKSGVDVRILTPHIADKKPVHAITRSHYPALLSAGVKVYEYTPGFIHSKTFVSDDKVGVVGTINLDYRSLYLHYECAVWLCGTASLLHIKDDYLATLEKCTEITLEQQRRLPLLQRLGLSILRIFSPLM